jgi:hypothetical protein
MTPQPLSPKAIKARYLKEPGGADLRGRAGAITDQVVQQVNDTLALCYQPGKSNYYLSLQATLLFDAKESIMDHYSQAGWIVRFEQTPKNEPYLVFEIPSGGAPLDEGY